MPCLKCKSNRIIRFVDGFGYRRVFCRDCGNSLPEQVFNAMQQRVVSDFDLQHKAEVELR